MTKREARRLAWDAASALLSSGGTPEPVDDMRDSDWRRFEEAWEEVLAYCAKRAGIEEVSR